MPKYDVIIKSGEKDYVKLKHVINSLKFLKQQPEGIYLINPDRFLPSEYKDDKRITVYADKEVMPTWDRTRIKFRPSWCFQSLMAVFQEITPNDYYLDMQGDNFFVREFSLFTEDDKPIFFVSPQHKHFHPPYFIFNEKMFGISGRVGAEWGIGREDSFIIDFMLYKKSIAKEIPDLHGGIDKFFDRACEIINDKCHPSEQDLYPNWCLTKYPELYVVKMDTQIRIDGKDFPDNFTDDEILDRIKETQTNPELSRVIALSCHTWHPWNYMK
jgi:hypothetical protein